MEIILKRIAKKNTYTIGRLFIGKSEEGRVKNSCSKGADSKPVVQREILPGKRLGDKRIIHYEVDESQLTKEYYFCDTLEPTWRNLLGIDLKPEEVDARYSRQSTVGVSGMSGCCSSSGISVDSVFEDSVGIFSFGESSFSCDWKLSRIG